MPQMSMTSLWKRLNVLSVANPQPIGAQDVRINGIARGTVRLGSGKGTRRYVT